MEGEPHINPYDGWYAELLDNAPNIDLMLQVMGDGESFAAHTIATFPATSRGRGQAELYLMLFTALGRFMNAGGDLFAVLPIFDTLSEMARDYRIQYPAGWELLSVLQDVQEPTFILANEKTGRALVVVEDERAELMDLAELSDLIR